jgi:hypothetical protein
VPFTGRQYLFGEHIVFEEVSGKPLLRIAERGTCNSEN